MRKLIFFISFGLLPLWAAIAEVYVGAHQNYVSAEYWNVAPWLILFSIPICVITSGIVALTLVIHKKCSGDESQKFRTAGLSFLGLVAVAIVAVGALKWMHVRSVEASKAEELQVLKFVGGDISNRHAGSPSPDVSLVTKTLIHGKAAQYDIYIRSKGLYAIVKVARANSPPTFTLACLTSLSPGQRDPFKDACDPSQRQP